MDMTKKFKTEYEEILNSVKKEDESIFEYNKEDANAFIIGIWESRHELAPAHLSDDEKISFFQEF